MPELKPKGSKISAAATFAERSRVYHPFYDWKSAQEQNTIIPLSAEIMRYTSLGRPRSHKWQQASSYCISSAFNYRISEGLSLHKRQYTISAKSRSRQDLACVSIVRRPRRIIVAITGATGAPLAISLLQRLRQLQVETHVILSKWGLATMKYEVDMPNDTVAYMQSLADHFYSPRDVSAAISSGSYQTDGMIVVPCSMKTLAGIRMGYDNDLITRAAGVTLKERRRLVLAARETPLSSIHLENMLEVTRAGAVVFPPMMTFYTRPKTVQDLVDQSVQRMIDLLELEIDEHDESGSRWRGFEKKAQGFSTRLE